MAYALHQQILYTRMYKIDSPWYRIRRIVPTITMQHSGLLQTFSPDQVDEAKKTIPDNVNSVHGTKYTSEDVVGVLELAEYVMTLPDLWYDNITDPVPIDAMQLFRWLSLIDFMNIDPKITQKINCLLVQQNLDREKLREGVLQWRLGVEPTPEMASLRDSWAAEVSKWVAMCKSGISRVAAKTLYNVAFGFWDDDIDQRPRSYIFAAGIGSLHRLHQATERGYIPGNYPPEDTRNLIGLTACVVAASNGHANCLEFLVNHGCNIDKRVSMEAATNGHVKVLEYLISIGTSISSDVSAVAAANGHLECLEYLFMKTSAPFHPLVTYRAIEGGNLECVKFLYEKGFPKFAGEMIDAVRMGRLEIVRYIYESYVVHDLDRWEPYVYVEAAKGGHIDILEYLRSLTNVPPWDSSACAAAAAAGRLDVLRYLRESDPASPCPWDEYVCAAAAASGHLHILRYLRESDPASPCPWDARTFLAAAKGGYMDCLDYGRQNGCPEATIQS